MLGKAMIDRLKAWLTEGEEPAGGKAHEVATAVASLLMEAGQVDGHLDEPERAAARQLLKRYFALTDAAARGIAAEAEQQAKRSTQLFGTTRLINERFSRAQRIELIEMLWEVAYADGVLDPLEDTMLRRVAGLLDVSDHERGAARLRVLQRRGGGAES
jgi:uncharacterized tellurite resistance protein B-like protein